MLNGSDHTRPLSSLSACLELLTLAACSLPWSKGIFFFGKSFFSTVFLFWKVITSEYNFYALLFTRAF